MKKNQFKKTVGSNRYVRKNNKFSKILALFSAAITLFSEFYRPIEIKAVSNSKFDINGGENDKQTIKNKSKLNLKKSVIVATSSIILFSSLFCLFGKNPKNDDFSDKITDKKQNTPKTEKSSEHQIAHQNLIAKTQDDNQVIFNFDEDKIPSHGGYIPIYTDGYWQNGYFYGRKYSGKCIRINYNLSEFTKYELLRRASNEFGGKFYQTKYWELIIHKKGTPFSESSIKKDGEKSFLEQGCCIINSCVRKIIIDFTFKNDETNSNYREKIQFLNSDNGVRVGLDFFRNSNNYEIFINLCNQGNHFE
jgi:hypothetical protein